jgi:pyruvate/2-oxoglutarate dehydrogenase complex dihydrolipoamide acyltransferase (E2) component
MYEAPNPTHMGYIVRMPQMCYEMEEGEVVDWEYDEGDGS